MVLAGRGSLVALVPCSADSRRGPTRRDAQRTFTQGQTEGPGATARTTGQEKEGADGAAVRKYYPAGK